MAAFRLPSRDYGPGPGPVCPYCSRIHHPFCSPLPPSLNTIVSHRLYNPAPSNLGLHSSLPPHHSSTITPTPLPFPGRSFGGHGGAGLEAFEADPLLDCSFRPQYAPPFPRSAESHFSAIPSSHHPRFPSPIRSQNHDLLHPASWCPPMGQSLEDSSHAHHQTEHVDRNPEGSSFIKFEGNAPTVLSGEPKRAGGEWLVQEDRFRVNSAPLISRVPVTPKRLLDQQHRFLDEFDRYPGAGLPRGHGHHFFESAERGSLSGVRVGSELSSGFAHDSSEEFLAESIGKYRGFGRGGTVDGDFPLNHGIMAQGEMARDLKRFYEESLQDHEKAPSNFKNELGNAEHLQAVQDTGERWIDRRDPTQRHFNEIGEHGLLQNRTSLDKYEKEGGFQRTQHLWNHSLITARRPDAPVEELMGYGRLLGAGSWHAGSRHDPSDLGDPYRGNNKIAEREGEFQDSSLVHLNSHQTRIPLYVTKTSSSLEQQHATQEPGHITPKSVWGGQYDRNDRGMQVQEKDEPKKAPASREEELLIEHGLLEDSPEDMSYHPNRSEPNLSFLSEGERTLHKERQPINRGADLKRGGPIEVLQVGTRMAEFQKYDSVSRSLSNIDRFQRGVPSLEHSQFSDERIRSEQQTVENFLSPRTEESNLLHVEKVLAPVSRDYTSSMHLPLGDSNYLRHHHIVNVSPAAGKDVHPFLEQVPLHLEDSRRYQFTSSQHSNQFRAGSFQSNRFQEVSETGDVEWKEKLHSEPSKQVDKVQAQAFEQQMHRDQQWNQQIQAHNQPYPEHTSYISRQVPLEQQMRLQQPTSFQTHPQRHVKQETPLQKQPHTSIHQPIKLSEPAHLHRKESVSHLPYYSQQSDFEGSGLPGQSASQERPDLPSHEQHQYNIQNNYLHTDLGEQLNFASNQILNQRQDIQVQSLMYEHRQIPPPDMILSNQQEQAHDLQQRKHFQYQHKLTQTGQQTHVHMQQQESQPHIETQGRGLLQSSNHQHQEVAQQILHNPKVVARQESPGLSSFLQQQQQQQTPPPSSMQRVHTTLEGQYHAVPQGGSLHDSSLSGLPDGAKPFSATHMQPPLPPTKTQQPPFCTPLQPVHIYPPLPPKVANTVVPPPPPSPPPAPPSPPPLPSSPPKLNVGISHPGNGASGMASSLSSAPHLSHDIQDTSMVLQYQHSQETLMQFSQPATIQGSSFQMMTHGQGSQLLHRMPFGHFVNHLQNLPPKIIQQQENSRIVDAVNIFRKPGRVMRPERFVIILRGLPGSGKSYLAKALRDVEVMNGGNAPRIHSMDDYFMAEVEEDQADDDGSTSASTYRGKKRAAKKVMKYCYEPEMEEIYRASMLRAFKKTLEEGMFSFIIVDDRNILVADFAQFWAIAKRTGYEVYVLEANYKDPEGCAARNVHEFTLEQIQKMAERWEPTPQLYLQLDVSSLFRGDDLNAQEITEVEMDADDMERDIDEQDDEFMPSDPGKEPPLANGTHLLISSDKWNDSDLKQDKLLRKRKRTSTQVDTSSNSTGSNEDASNALSGLMKAYGKKDKCVRWGDLQDGEESERGFSIGSVPGKKRHLVIGPGSGYNEDSNPSLDGDIEQGSELQIDESKDARKNWKLFEQLRDEQEAFKAVFARRRHRIRGLDEEEAAL